MKTRGRERRNLNLGLLLLLTVSSLLLFYRLSDIEMKPWDESVYALRSKEMYLSRSLLAPLQEGKVAWSSGKPPLGFWLIIFSFHLFGFSPLALRLPFAMAGLGCILLLFLIGREISDRRTGTLSALSLLLMPGFLLYSRRAILEPLLTFLFLAALLFYHRSRTTNSLTSSMTYALGSGLSVGLAILAKQVVGSILLPAILIHDLLVEKAKTGWYRRCFRSLLVLAVALVSSGWWFLVMYLRHGPIFLHHYLGINVFHRLTHTMVARSTRRIGFPALLFQHAGPLTFWVGLGGIILLLFMAVRVYRSRTVSPGNTAIDSILIPLLLFSAFYYLVFGLISRTLLFWYPFPLLPLFGLGQGLVLSEAMAATEKVGRARHLSSFSCILPLLSLGLSLSQGWFGLSLLSLLLFSMWLPSLARATSTGQRLLPLLGLLSLGLYFSLCIHVALNQPTYHSPDPYPRIRQLFIELGAKEVIFDRDLKGKVRHQIYPLRFYLEVPVTKGDIGPYLAGKMERRDTLVVTSAGRWIELRKKAPLAARAVSLPRTGLVLFDPSRKEKR